MNPAKYRNFGGKQYWCHTQVFATSKTEADRKAKLLKEQGWMVRVVSSREYKAARFRGDKVGRSYKQYFFYCRRRSS